MLFLNCQSSCEAKYIFFIYLYSDFLKTIFDFIVEIFQGDEQIYDYVNVIPNVNFAPRLQ